MKNYNLIPQKRNNYCVCSVLQAIFDKYNIKIFQEKIAENLTPSKNGFKINDYKIKNFLGNLGFNYNFYWYDETPFNEPDILLYEMQQKNGIIGIKTHVYLLKEFKDPKLYLIDPKDCSKKKKDIFDLLNDMKKGKVFFGLIEKLK